MRIFKNKTFSKWAAKEGLNDTDLRMAVDELERGLIDANLGGHVIKKRVALKGRGKSGGVRTLLVYKITDKTFFVYGFAKSVRTNISINELRALKLLAKELRSYSDNNLLEAMKNGVLVEVKNNG
jgi:hypothetical protein